MALLGLPPLVPVNELRQVGRLLRIADYKLVLQQLLSSGSLENTCPNNHERELHHS